MELFHVETSSQPWSAEGATSRLHSPLLAWSTEGLAQLPALLAVATQSAAVVRALRPHPLPSGAPAEVLRAAMDALGPEEVPLDGVGPERALRRLAQMVADRGLDLSHPNTAAHLQPPVLAVAVAADALASASNASVDTYDSGPSAIAAERWVVRSLAKLAGLGERADGVLTPGGSLSNLLGLLLARDAAAARRQIDARREGVAALPGPVVFCSELAHFSVQRACAALGLGEDAVRPLPVDRNRRMSVGALSRALRELDPARHTPLALVATAGTTDFGSVDPLLELSALARAHHLWLHVDAAYGFGALFSERLAPRLVGLERADSVTLDLHKLGWQPAAASVLLVSDAASFAALSREVAYLNPSDDADRGLDGLLGRSLQTTRRPDALKMVATLLAHGRRGLGAMVDRCHELARHAEQRLREDARFELVAPAELTTVVFRYRGLRAEQEGEAQDALNAALRRHLLERGTAVIGRTTTPTRGPGSAPRVCLKLTLLNPVATPTDVDALLGAIVRAGSDVERRSEGTRS